ncbi:unnamed protein product [Didymodactylos carnosus]|uniref:L-dopachrome isomerase n=1 Tax=Didymodactylos carnosus TaxID=1234261 RepID=A0A815APR3_9BILA|nr:unnamed protein product [Didymodactylos carnosus]CAF1487178.1 unnamed protein product [Didymodactylos carnosus]CAF4034680.1 unnamed protein product [Didymodactylos carnosus]CAF4276899.1 unnamed protein product [Didymodactylos carnosus]
MKKDFLKSEGTKYLSERPLQDLSKTLAELTGIPEKFFSVHIQGGQKMLFGGSYDPTAIIHVTSINLKDDLPEKISNEVMTLFENELNIPATRMYIHFVTTKADMVGYNKSTMANY